MYKQETLLARPDQPALRAPSGPTRPRDATRRSLRPLRGDGITCKSNPILPFDNTAGAQCAFGTSAVTYGFTRPRWIQRFMAIQQNHLNKAVLNDQWAI